MTPTILIDTDVLLDVALKREPHAGASVAVLRWAEQEAGSGHLAWHSLANTAYVLKGDTRRFLLELLEFLEVVETSTEAAQRALKLPRGNVDDALQAAAAIACGAEYIVTRNVRDYSRSPVRAISPTEFMRGRT